MGTNYYHRTGICECCRRYDERHIGKSSAGWQFSFQGYRDSVPIITSFEDWKRELQIEGKIFDEYGREVSFEDFVKLVKEKQSEEMNTYDYCAKEGSVNMTRRWKDEEGYSFSEGEFS